eukprot:gnl/TRDRNA2_/TRDRNA2_155861_c1_seq3.p1 gnl/TRDRNA2_/TRDRNA2_155861_c1~~gnl/TRDRNA2_/TRDRNA2_155861_c1_seq3.p1  ORF type:complete len:128 (+),score=15.37 gnl/TRDRNA2_/TRDRNA2_155861_c1_seq3:145-528(+)
MRVAEVVSAISPRGDVLREPEANWESDECAAERPFCRHRFVMWQELRPSDRQLWATLGWTTKEHWDGKLQSHMLHKDWNQFTSAEREAAEALGYDHHLWLSKAADLCPRLSCKREHLGMAPSGRYEM